MYRPITVLVLLFASLAAPQGAAAANLSVPYGNLYPFTIVAATNWDGDPPGANDWNCKPGAEHPYPVVLVTSTFLSAAVNWASLSPYLHNRGYCVFTFNYGRDPFIAPGLNGMGYMQDSAAETAAFVDRVLATTGASKVDIVGHSQGGIQSRYFIQHLGGADKVHRAVLLSSPYSFGGDALEDVLMRLLRLLPESAYEETEAIGPIPVFTQFADPYFWDELNATDDGLAPQVDFIQISSRSDEAALSGAYDSPAVPNARTRYVQQAQPGEWWPCLVDRSTHFAIPYTRRAVAMIGNALDPARAVVPPCDVVLLYSP